MIHFRRLSDGSIEVRATHPRDGLTLVRNTYTSEEWAALTAGLRVEVTPCPA